MARIDSFTKKWASVPSQFERPADSLIDRGWAGGAAEDPPEAKWENWWHNRVDEALAEIEQNGALTWFEDVPYGIGATARSGGKNWIAAIASTGIEPGGVDDVGHWQELSLEIASKAEAEDGDEATANNVKRMTPLRVLQAIKAQLISATESVVGMLRIGTEAEINAGVRDDVVVTPKKLRMGFSISLTANGYVALPAWLGGLIIQWGTRACYFTGSAQNNFVTFPVAFPNGAFIANVSFAGENVISTTIVTGVGSLTASGFSIRTYSNNTFTQPVAWIAIGY